jgi:hypothetical protein
MTYNSLIREPNQTIRNEISTSKQEADIKQDFVPTKLKKNDKAQNN